MRRSGAAAKLSSPAGGTDQDADADGDRECQQRALLRLIGDSSKGIIANPAAHSDRPAAEIGGPFGRGALARARSDRQYR